MTEKEKLRLFEEVESKMDEETKSLLDNYRNERRQE